MAKKAVVAMAAIIGGTADKPEVIAGKGDRFDYDTAKDTEGYFGRGFVVELPELSDGPSSRPWARRNEYLAAENRIIKAQLNSRMRLSDAEGGPLGEIGHRLGRKVLADVATIARPETILGWYRKLVARKFDGRVWCAAGCRYLLHDRDTKFTRSFWAIIASGRVKPPALPARSPNLNAHAERWVRSVKEECLSKLILFGEAPCGGR